MPADFFCSYTRADNDAYLRRFVADLSETVRVKLGQPKGALPGFFDQRDIERGAAWDPVIVGALAEAKVFVALASPGYFKSEYCAREFALFAGRAPANPLTGALSPVIKPVVWNAVAVATMPQPFSARQFMTGDPESAVNKLGLRYIIKQIAKYRIEYNDFVESLADDIITTAAAHVVPPLAPVQHLAQVAPAWIVPMSGANLAPPGSAPSDPTRVKFVYVAANPALVASGRDTTSYQQRGGSDWKPFWPDPKRIHPVLQNVASSDQLAFSSEELVFSPSIVKDIRDAWRQRDIVVIVVDAWSVFWDMQQAAVGYHSELVSLDETNAIHWCVLVPWNDRDPEMNDPTVKPAIEEAIKATFRYKGGHAIGYARNALYYRDGIRSFDELKLAVLEVLTRLKEEIKKVAEITRPMPVGPSKSVVTGSRAPETPT